TGTLDYGQGHASPFAQVLSNRLGVPFEKIRLLQGDSDELVAGGGTGGSRSMMQSGGAIVEASDIVMASPPTPLRIRHAMSIACPKVWRSAICRSTISSPRLPKRHSAV
ncbi:MAG TPA: molybdopterin cofactor-binding domain-containing protein, partial [Acetobacteraceae bacterium]|nr:molybdopterin cofactor-binding domain-containing protein [Acetobacteraceae bacterium]